MKVLKNLFFLLIGIRIVKSFAPLPNFNLSNLFGTWKISSYFDFAGNNAEMMCQEVVFSQNTSKRINYEFNEYVVDLQDWDNHTINIEVSSNSAIFLYAGMTFVVSNYSNINGEETMIFAANWTNDYYMAQYFVYAFTRNTEAVVDLREYMMSYGLDPYYNFNYFVINQGCYSNGVIGINNFDPSTLIQNWNILAIYDIKGYYNWQSCSNVNLTVTNNTEAAYNLDLTGYQGLKPFKFSSEVYLNPQDSSMFWGYSLNPRTSLIVTSQLNDQNLLIITGDQSFGMFLSSNATEITNNEEHIFKNQLEQLEEFQPTKLYILNNHTPLKNKIEQDNDYELFFELIDLQFF